MQIVLLSLSMGGARFPLSLRWGKVGTTRNEGVIMYPSQERTCWCFLGGDRVGAPLPKTPPQIQLTSSSLLEQSLTNVLLHWRYTWTGVWCEPPSSVHQEVHGRHWRKWAIVGTDHWLRHRLIFKVLTMLRRRHHRVPRNERIWETKYKRWIQVRRSR